jgi:hypothetical protein
MTGVPFRNTASQTTNFQPRRTVDGRSKQVFRLTGLSQASALSTHMLIPRSPRCAKLPNALLHGLAAPLNTESIP